MRKHEKKPEYDINYLKKLGYEPRDIDLKTIVYATIFLFGFFGATAVATIGVFWLFVKQEIPPEKGGPAVIARKMPPPDYPMLQERPVSGDPHMDIQKFRTEEDMRVKTPAWKNKQKGIARIPVDRAMDLLLEKGLPTRGVVPAKTAPAAGDNKPAAGRE
jgi:hypothetical protein